MSIDLGSVNISFGLDASRLMAGAASIDRVFSDIESSGNQMGKTVETAITGMEAALTGSSAAAKTAATGIGAVESSATSASSAMKSIDNSAASAATAMGLTSKAALGTDAAFDTAGASALAAAKTIKQVDDAADQASRGLNKAGPAADTFAQKIKAAEQNMTTIGLVLAGFGAAVTAAMGLAVAGFVRFEAAMRNLNSIAGLTETELRSLSESVKDLSGSVGRGPAELAEGLYEIASSGFQGSEGLAVLSAAAVSATAGLTSTSTAAKAITAVLNSYGKSADEAGDVSDILFSTVNLGVVSFEELSRSLGSVLPIAAALDVPFEEIAAAMAELTLNGISAAEAETALAAALRTATNPTTEMAAAVQAYGAVSAEAIVQSEGLVGFLQFLTEASGGTTAGLTALLGTAEATTAVLALMNDGGIGLTKTVGEMSAAMQDGATAQKVFDEQSKSTQFAMQQLSASLERAKIEAGEALAPFVNLAVNGLKSLVDGFNSLPGPVQSAATALVAIVGASAGLGGALLLALPKILEFREALKSFPLIARGFNAALSGLKVAFNPMTLAVAGLVAVGYKLFESWQKQKQAAEEYEAALGNLDDTIELLRRRGDDAIANQAQGFKDLVSSVSDVTAELEYLNTLNTPGYAPSPESLAAFAAQEAAIQQLQDSANLTIPVLDRMNEALGDPNINVTAYLEWANNLISAAAATTDAADDVEALQTILNRPLSDFANHVETDVIAPLTEMKATLEDVQGAIGDYVGRAQDLQLDGMLEAAEDVNALGKAFESLGTPVSKTVDVFNPVMNSMDRMTVIVDQLSADKVPVLSKSFNVLSDSMASGNFDNTAILAEVDRILNDTSLTADQAADHLFDLAYRVNNTSEFMLDAANSAENLAWGLEASASSADLLAAKMDWATQALLEYVSSGRDFFEVMDAMSESVDMAGTSSDVLTGRVGALLNRTNLFSRALAVATSNMTSFEKSLHVAEGLSETGAALDTALYYFNQLDQMGQRSSNAGAVADFLFGPDGNATDGIGPLRDLYDAGRIGQEQFNAAVASGTAIQESNLRVQEDLNKIRVDQLPLLEQEQLAYENYVQALSEMEPLEQRRAIALADQAYQSQLASISSNLLAAALGEMPKEVVTDMVVSAAQADPVLKDLLLQYGYIEEGADGTITVNFPDGAGVTTTLADINSSLADLIDLLDNGALDKSYTVKVGAEIEWMGAALDGKQGFLDQVNAFFGVEDGSSDTTITYVAKLQDDATAPLATLQSAVDAMKDVEIVITAKYEGFGEAPPADPSETPVTQLPNTGSGPNSGIPPVIVPALDTSVFDASVLTFTANLQSILTAVNAVFVIGIPANITTGMTTAGINVGIGITGWNTAMAAPLQAGLTAINAIFTIAIPANVLTGLQSGSTNISAEVGTWSGLIDAVAPAMGTSGLNAGAVAGFGAVNGLVSAEGSISAEVGSWSGIVDGEAGELGTAGYNAGAAAGYGVANGMSSALGSIRASAAEIAAIVTSTLALQLLIASPSKVTTRMGEFVGEGLAVGMRSKYSEIQSASAGMARAALDGYNRTMDTGKIRILDPNQGTPGTGGGDTGSPVTDTSTWKDLIAKGLEDAASDALKNSGFKTDKTVGSLFNEEDWLARVAKMGEKGAQNIADLFYGRTWQNSTDATILDGKYLEQYLGGVIPSEDITNQPPGNNPTDPTRPPGSPRLWVRSGNGEAVQMNRANTKFGAGGGGTTVINNYDNRTSMGLRSEELVQTLDGAAKGRAANGALKNASSKRMQTGGARPAPVRG